MDHVGGGEDQGWQVLSSDVTVQANDLSIARDVGQGERRARSSDERSRGDGGQSDCEPASDGQVLPRAWRQAQREFGASSYGVGGCPKGNRSSSG